ncbi:unnamed protein product [marine sediment metagenome]|uniref:Uncharacterized protein n=1 Tax=marine sediment metagenome TaxID=412755 RepID=X1HZN6_9ZZZZ
MSEKLRSKCCGAKIYWESVEIDPYRHIDTPYCSKCHKPCEPCEVEEKEEERK